MDFLSFIPDTSFFNNSATQWFWAGVIFFGWFIGLKIFQVVVLARLQSWSSKTKNEIDDTFVGIVSGIGFFFYFVVALYFGLASLELPEYVDTGMTILLMLAITLEVVKASKHMIDFSFKRYARKKGLGEDPAQEMQSRAMFRTLKTIVAILVWSAGLLLALSNIGVDITSLIAGLGIGGIAVALALQNVLGDLFSSFSIYFDKPFEVGDFIVIGDDMGTVERIGMKSTHIRTLLGEQLVVSNQELTTARIQNFKRMDRRRVVVSLGVTYDTSQKKLEMIPKMVEDIIKKVDKTEFDRCHFHEYGDSALLYELVFYVDTPDYNMYMDIRQDVNLQIFEAFAKEKIEFAYPTQTLYVKK